MLRAFCGAMPSVHSTAYIDESAQVVGDVTIGEESSIWMNVVIRGDVHQEIASIRHYAERYVGYRLDYMQQT